jgi:hypothetical protein
MQNIIKKSLVWVAIATINFCSAQLKEYDLAVTKHYPPVGKKLVKPQAFTYKSNNGVLLQYQLSEGDYYRTKVDSLAAINKLDALDSLDAVGTYTDGAMNAWVEGSFKINNITYLLYGSYAGEGYLQGALYDKNKVLYGLLEWESGNDITATLKTKTSTFKYNLTNGKKYPKPSVPKNDALETLLGNRKINEIERANIEANYGTGSDVSVINKKFKPELYLNDLQAIDTLSTLIKKKEKLKEWGWVINRGTESKGSKYMNIFYVVERDKEMRLQVEFADPNNSDAKMKFKYKVSNCCLKYIEGFVNDAKNKGYKVLEDKKALYKMQNADRVIVINKSIIHNNEQYFKIEVM